MNADYKPFRLREILDSSKWGEILKLTDEEVSALLKEWEEVTAHNKSVVELKRAERTRLATSLEAVLTDCGVPIRKGGKVTKDYTRILALCPKLQYPWNESSKYEIPTVSPHSNAIVECKGVKYRISTGGSGSRIPLSEFRTTMLRQIANEDILRNLQDKKFVAAMKWCIENKAEIDSGAEGFVDAVEEAAKKKWKEEHTPDQDDDEEFRCDCQECETVYFGEPRCKCGNRRVSFFVEGDLHFGFNWATEVY